MRSIAVRMFKGLFVVSLPALRRISKRTLWNINCFTSGERLSTACLIVAASIWGAGSRKKKEKVEKEEKKDISSSWK